MGHGEYEDAAKGRCRFYEAEHSECTYGRFTRHVVGYGMVADTEPMCFMGKINLTAILTDEGGREKLLEAINADRKCEAWYPYMPGLSPKEHYDELVMQRLEAERTRLRTTHGRIP